MWLRGFDFVVIEEGREEEGRTSGETAGRRSKRREEGKRRKEPAGKPLDVGTSGERGA